MCERERQTESIPNQNIVNDFWRFKHIEGKRDLFEFWIKSIFKLEISFC